MRFSNVERLTTRRFAASAERGGGAGPVHSALAAAAHAAQNQVTQERTPASADGM
jgi:hypothetical protein